MVSGPRDWVTLVDLLTSLGLNFPTCPMGEGWIPQSLRGFPLPRLRDSLTFLALGARDGRNLIAVRCKGGFLGESWGKKVKRVAVFIIIIIIATSSLHELFHLFLAPESGRPVESPTSCANVGKLLTVSEPHFPPIN